MFPTFFKNAMHINVNISALSLILSDHRCENWLFLITQLFFLYWEKLRLNGFKNHCIHQTKETNMDFWLYFHVTSFKLNKFLSIICFVHRCVKFVHVYVCFSMFIMLFIIFFILIVTSVIYSIFGQPLKSNQIAHKSLKNIKQFQLCFPTK